MDYVSLYIIAAHREEALAIAHSLVEEKLAACVTLLGEVTSVYRWQDRIVQGQEIALIAKTRSALAEQAIAHIKSMHSYECPCIVAWPIVAGEPQYLDWLANETQIK